MIELKRLDIKCPGCAEEFYCSAECKERAWNHHHKAICRKGISQLRKYVRDSGNFFFFFFFLKTIFIFITAASSSGKIILAAVRLMGTIMSSPQWEGILANRGIFSFSYFNFMMPYKIRVLGVTGNT
jgi:hypothetical protein